MQIVSLGDNLHGMSKLIFWEKYEQLDCAVDGMPSQNPMLGANVAISISDGWKTNVAFAHPYHVGKSCSKFCLILSSGLGGDSVTDR